MIGTCDQDKITVTDCFEQGLREKQESEWSLNLLNSWSREKTAICVGMWVFSEVEVVGLILHRGPFFLRKQFISVFTLECWYVSRHVNDALGRAWKPSAFGKRLRLSQLCFQIGAVPFSLGPISQLVFLVVLAFWLAVLLFLFAAWVKLSSFFLPLCVYLYLTFHTWICWMYIHPISCPSCVPEAYD